MGLLHIPSLKRKNHFHSGRHTNIWKAAKGEAKAFGRKTGLHMTENKETKKNKTKEYFCGNHAMV